MKKIIIELEDDIYKKLNEMKNDLKHKFKDVEITPEMVAAELITDAVKIEERFKGARDNMNDMFNDLNSMSPDDMLNNLNDLLSSLGNLKDKAKAAASGKSTTKNENGTSNDSEDEEEFEFKS